MGACFRQPKADPGTNTLKVRHNLIIPEPQDMESFSPKKCITRAVVRSIHVLTSIHFDDQSCLEASEIGDIRPDRKLATESEAFELALAENAPQSAFRQRHVASEFACPIPLLSVSHMHFL